MAHPVLLIAGLLAVFISVVHSWLGEKRVIGPLLALDHREGPLARGFMRRLVRYAWHITSIAWTGMGLALVVLARSPLEPTGRLVAGVIGATFLVMGAMTLIAGRGRHLAWLVFLAIAVLCFAPLV
jgi:hypothetical protein